MASTVIAFGITHAVVEQALGARQAGDCLHRGAGPVLRGVTTRPPPIGGVAERLVAVRAGKRHRAGFQVVSQQTVVGGGAASEEATPSDPGERRGGGAGLLLHVGAGHAGQD